MRFPINFEMEFFHYIDRKDCALLFLEEPYGIKNLRTQDCTGEFLICKRIENIISSFSGLKKCNTKDDA
jgi:hypothetical protein